jgi:putative DNA primase/helicase
MTLLEHALAYASQGWPVFPCHPATKQPLVKSPVEGEGGLKLATTDEARIREWWARWPQAMIGLPTGRAIGAFVVDVDAGEDKTTGEVFEAAALRIQLEGAIGTTLPPTRFATTPRGGVHLYFRYPDGDEIGNRAGLLGKGSRIDIRGDGGYVIAPPSLRKDGVAYAWGDAVEVAAAPAALIDLVLRRGAFAEAPAAAGIGARAAARVKPPAADGGGSIAAGEEAVRKYGLSALDAELQNVRQAQPGGRNDALNVAALKLAQLVASGALNEHFVRAALEGAAGDSGLIKDDGLRAVRATIESGFRAGRKQPRDLGEIRRAAADRERRPRAAAVRSSSPKSGPADSAAAAPAPREDVEGKPSSQTGAGGAKATSKGGGGGERKPPAEDPGARNLRLALFPLTDLGNAERFRERCRDRLLWCAAIGWLVWDGKRWSRDGAEELVKLAEHDTVRMIQEEAKAVRASGRKDQPDAPKGARDWLFDEKKSLLYSDKIASWGRSSEAVNKLGALSKRGAPYLAVSIGELDADKFKINVNNGTLVVRKSADEDYIQFKPHDPADLITKLAPVDYDQGATCENYDRFIGRIQPEGRMREFLHQWFGLSLTGDVSEQKLVYFYGKGGNGKSVLVDAVSYIAGDYGRTLPIETFLDHGKPRNGSQATPDIAILPGVRFLRTSEAEKNSKLAEAMVKLMTGGEQMSARDLNMPLFWFYPQFKMTMSGNYRPQISGTDEGIWRRVRLVPFNVTIPKEERDPHMIDKLRNEASGFLNRLLDGLRVWLDKGLQEPEDVLKATADYRSASDPLGRFLAACVAASPGDRVQSSELYKLYCAWCVSAGETAWKQRGFSMAMDERGFTRKQSDVVWWLDMKAVKTVNDFVDYEGKPIKARHDTQEEVADMEI